MAWDGVNEPVLVTAEELPEGYRVELVAEGLTRFASMAFAPDGRIFLCEQHTGIVRVLDADGTPREEPFVTIDGVAQSHETGLIGIAFHPEFPDPAYVYLFYVLAGQDGKPERSIIERYTERDGVGVDPVVLAEIPTPGDMHAGGSLKFGPDGKLYVTLGENRQGKAAQNLDSPRGKIFRLNEDGSAPEDNPFAGNPDADARVYALGFRNPFDMAYYPPLQAWLATENADAEYDEINIIRPGGNYGFPESLGFWIPEVLPDMVTPIWTYLLHTGLSGIDVYTADRLSYFTGDVFFCQFHRGGLLHHLRLDGERVVSDTVLATGCTTDVAVSPDGLIYFAEGTQGRLWRIADTPVP